MKLISTTSDQYKRRLVREIRKVLDKGNGAYYNGTRFNAVRFSESRLSIKPIGMRIWYKVDDIFMDCILDSNGRQIVASRSVR